MSMNNCCIQFRKRSGRRTTEQGRWDCKESPLTALHNSAPLLYLQGWGHFPVGEERSGELCSHFTIEIDGLSSSCIILSCKIQEARDSRNIKKNWSYAWSWGSSFTVFSLLPIFNNLKCELYNQSIYVNVHI